MNIGLSLTSSMHVGEEYIDLTRIVAKRLASEGFGVVYGGTSYGMMEVLAEEYKAHGGTKLYGVMAQDLINVTVGYKAYERLDEQYLEPSMEMRKYRMAQLSDGFLILPGGYGSFEEFGSYLGGNINKLYSKPIVLFNHGHFYDTLLAFLDEMVEKQFSKIPVREAVLVTDDLDAACAFFTNYKEKEFEDKFV